jgi:hypothetical protein
MRKSATKGFGQFSNVFRRSCSGWRVVSPMSARRAMAGGLEREAAFAGAKAVAPG